ncbi:hypothetical protein [Mycobacterium uberis]|uniref:hypothetical protein n=1 Tax=Mycobacterium uberis TaxID=2162698 RepID=UPI000E3065AD|nr:hypothetical protein [Mycobacterium uberis]
MAVIVTRGTEHYAYILGYKGDMLDGVAFAVQRQSCDLIDHSLTYLAFHRPIGCTAWTTVDREEQCKRQPGMLTLKRQARIM